MSKSGVNKKNQELEGKTKQLNINYQNLIVQNKLLKEKNQNLLNEKKLLKELIIDQLKKNENLILNPPLMHRRVSKYFYFQIILGILVIILSLGFHILYLSVTDCLLFTNGDSGCWIKSWLGMNVHASFYLDLLLYSLIGLQVILIIFIIKNQFSKISKTFKK